MLRTNLTHLETKEDILKTVKENENTMICCGRMGPMCIPVYKVMEILEKEYTNVAFRDMDFDIPDASYIKDLPECIYFMGLPFVVYFKNGKVVDATSGIQSKEQVKNILDKHFK